MGRVFRMNASEDRTPLEILVVVGMGMGMEMVMTMLETLLWS